MINSLLKIAGVYKAYEKYLIEQIKYGPMPEHIGIILDGNRRWATEKALNSTDGHWAGAKVGEEVLDWCLEYGTPRKYESKQSAGLISCLKHFRTCSNVSKTKRACTTSTS